jgi:hypothetical protein
MEIDVQTVVFREGDHVVAQCLDVDVSSFGVSEEDALATSVRHLNSISRMRPRTRSRRWRAQRSAG